jgi:hypothetical protein
MGWLVNVVNSFALTVLTSLNKKTTSCNFNKKQLYQKISETGRKEMKLRS